MILLPFSSQIEFEYIGSENKLRVMEKFLETKVGELKLSELDKWNLINDAVSFDELSFSIRSIADEDGSIGGKSSNFSAVQMITRLAMIQAGHPLQLLTRAYGIRRQAAYLLIKTGTAQYRKDLS